MLISRTLLFGLNVTLTVVFNFTVLLYYRTILVFLVQKFSCHITHGPLSISLYDFVHLSATAKIFYLVLALRVLFFDEWNANMLPFLENIL